MRSQIQLVYRYGQARVKQAELDWQMAQQKLAADGSPKIQEITEDEADVIEVGGAVRVDSNPVVTPSLTAAWFQPLKPET